MSGPVKKFTAGAVSCSLWENQIVVGGVPRTVLKAMVERRYKDASGQWKSSNSYGRNEIPLAIHVLQQAFSYMLSQGEQEMKIEEETIG